MTKTHLVLFFTKGVSLKTWDNVGMFEREVALYRRLQEHGVQVSFVTYGHASDQAYADRLPGMRILCNRWRLSASRYARLLPLLHAPYLWRAGVFKTNQTGGAEIALRVARFHHKRLIVRCGYMRSLNMRIWREQGCPDADTLIREAEETEREVFREADRVVVTTSALKAYAVEQYQLPQSKVRVIPNYVLTDLFQPDPEMSTPDNRLCFIGRLEAIKNLPNLFEAIQGLDIELWMIGEGSLRQPLAEQACQLGLNVRFLGRVPHHQLPTYLNSCDLYVQPSLIEGHPKTILEAMSCGLPVIGGDAPGVRDLIKHGETGYLCGTSSQEIRAAICTVLDNNVMRHRLGRQARQFVVEQFSLPRVLELELTLYEDLLANG
ncbi:MAG: glycosyltransferase family 4 protein [Anaerolineae bacterium]